MDSPGAQRSPIGCAPSGLHSPRGRISFPLVRGPGRFFVVKVNLASRRICVVVLVPLTRSRGSSPSVLPRPIVVALCGRVAAGPGRMNWQDIQARIRTCPTCRRQLCDLFVPLDHGWPNIPEPLPHLVLFLSEAPTRAGSFWTIQLLGVRKDALRGELLPLAGIPPGGDDGGPGSFVASGLFLLQALPRPLRSSIASAPLWILEEMLQHPVWAHLQQQVKSVSPRAVLALGRTAALALSILHPHSLFARAFEGGGLSAVHGQIFAGTRQPLLSATYLPTGKGRFRRHLWEGHIRRFLQEARRIPTTCQHDSVDANRYRTPLST